MLKAPKKLTKRQIKEDKFVTFYLQAQAYLSENGRNILTGLGIVVVLVVAALVFTKSKAEKEHVAVVELTKGRLEYFAGNYDTAIGILKNLIEEYDGTKSGEVALFYLADSYYNTANYVNAEKYFQEFIDKSDDDLLLPSAYAGLAACLEQQGNYEVAAQKYREGAEKYAESYLAPDNLFQAARCYVEAGKNDEAKSLLNKLIETYPKSTFKNSAEIFLAELNQK